MTDSPAATDVREPKAYACGYCDFSSGTRGMDRCAKCDGTGSVFRVAGKSFPNTKRGYGDARLAAARAALSLKEPADDK